MIESRSSWRNSSRGLIKQSVVIFTVLLAMSAPNAFALTKSNQSSDNINTFKLSLGSAELNYDYFRPVDEPSALTFSYIRKVSELESLSTNLAVSYTVLADSTTFYINDGSTVYYGDVNLTGYKLALGGQLEGNIGNIVAPFIGAGVSILGIEYEVGSAADSDSIFGYYLELGSNFYITEGFGLSIDYNKFSGSDLLIAGITGESDHDQVSFGLLWRF
ncbi:MAG: outer membrane beta-barrel protein [Nitrospinota bacterium]